jgi:hypothetical protein
MFTGLTPIARAWKSERAEPPDAPRGALRCKRCSSRDPSESPARGFVRDVPRLAARAREHAGLHLVDGRSPEEPIAEVEFKISLSREKKASRYRSTHENESRIGLPGAGRLRLGPGLKPPGRIRTRNAYPEKQARGTTQTQASSTRPWRPVPRAAGADASQTGVQLPRFSNDDTRHKLDAHSPMRRRRQIPRLRRDVVTIELQDDPPRQLVRS